MLKPIISLIVVVISIGFIFFNVIPAYELNVARRGDIESLTKILDTSSEIKTLIGKTKDNLNSIEPNILSRFEVFLPAKVDPIRFANNIQAIARDNRIILTNIKVDSAEDLAKLSTTGSGANAAVQGLVNAVSLGAQISKAESPILSGVAGGSNAPKGKYVTTKATLTFTTTYESFQLFLNDLERSLGLINVTSLSFGETTDGSADKKSKVPTDPVYGFTMTIETYSLN